MRNKALQAWAWVLIYAGLLLVMMGVYLGSARGAVVFIALGALVAVAGAVLIVVRSRRPNQEE
jgi:hypothetical protein